MTRIKDDFNPKAPISQVPASWFNAVAKFINELMGGLGISVNKDGSPPLISVDPNVVQTKGESNGKVNENIPENETQSPLPTLPVQPDTTVWIRGKTTHKVYDETTEQWIEETDNDGHKFLCGVTIPVFSREVRAAGSVWNFCRPWTFDENGALCKIGPEQFVTTTLMGAGS